VRTVYIFSLPRSGSTLLQRMLVKIPNVQTTAEHWLLLHLFSITNSEHGLYTIYGGRQSVDAFNHYQELFGGKGIYFQEALKLNKRLHQQCTHPDTKWFVEKTPRYHLIVNEIIENDPDAKFIFLWRNPLSIFNSIVSTWGHGKWNLHKYDLDIEVGFSRLVKAFKKFETRSLSINYEHLISNPDKEMSRVCNYLGVNTAEVEWSNLPPIDGIMGDPNQFKARYKNITDVPKDIGKKYAELATPFRKRIIRQRLKILGEKPLAAIGYSMEDLLNEVDRIPTNMSKIPKDFMIPFSVMLFRYLEPYVMYHKYKEGYRFKRWRYPLK